MHGAYCTRHRHRHRHHGGMSNKTATDRVANSCHCNNASYIIATTLKPGYLRTAQESLFFTLAGLELGLRYPHWSIGACIMHIPQPTRRMGRGCCTVYVMRDRPICAIDRWRCAVDGSIICASIDRSRSHRWIALRYRQMTARCRPTVLLPFCLIITV